MLAVKTTCKDRWRQILNEVDKDRIPTKHLLTLQEGVSQNQFNEMLDEGVQLVVPFGLHKSYPKKVRPHLMTLESFLADIRLLAGIARTVLRFRNPLCRNSSFQESYFKYSLLKNLTKNFQTLLEECFF